MTPATRNRPEALLAHDLPFAIDNAAFSHFDQPAYELCLKQFQGWPGCMFVVCPDVVGDARATLERFQEWAPRLQALGWPVALVGQDGAEDLELPWEQFSTYFIGGGDPWKTSQASADLAREAKRRGKWLHVGRVNTRQRVRWCASLGADSVDGSGQSKWPDTNIPRMVHWIKEAEGEERETTLVWEMDH